MVKEAYPYFSFFEGVGNLSTLCDQSIIYPAFADPSGATPEQVVIANNAEYTCSGVDAESPASILAPK